MSANIEHIPLMAHLVAGYPTAKIAEIATQALIDGGAAFLEVQFPFSDPSADGKAIQNACAQSLAQGFTVQEGFEFINTISTKYPQTPVCIMSYANIAFKMGITQFVKKAREAGAFALIIPDLPFDADEGLAQECKKQGLVSIPVAAPSMSKARVAQLLEQNPSFIYAALRAGITGSKTTIDLTTIQFIQNLSVKGAKILGGFGIQTGKQAQSLAPHVYAVVAGSVFVNLIEKNTKNFQDSVYTEVLKKAKELSSK